MNEHPFTITEQHPTGVTALTATALVPLIVWLVSLIPGVEMPTEAALGLAMVIFAVPTLIASWRSPRITLPDVPSAPVDRGITPLESVEAPDAGEVTGRTTSARTGRLQQGRGAENEGSDTGGAGAPPAGE